MYDTDTATLAKSFQNNSTYCDVSWGILLTDLTLKVAFQNVVHIISVTTPGRCKFVIMLFNQHGAESFKGILTMMREQFVTLERVSFCGYFIC